MKRRNDAFFQVHTSSSPPSIFCVAAPSDEPLLLQWEKHLLPLQQAGLLTFWSELHLQAGTDRMATRSAHLKQADAVVFLLSADFFADETCLTLMHETLLRQQREHLRLIPLVVRPVAWQESELSTFVSLPTNRIAVATWEPLDEGWRQAVIGLERLLGLPTSERSFSIHKGPTRDRERMLRLLRRIYQTEISDSLQKIAWMELSLDEYPDAVHNATHVLQHLPNHTKRHLPAGTSLLSVYNQAEEELLILGAAGAGKSTLLIHLALDLLTRADVDPTQPLPVIIPLSSWAVSRTTIAIWFVEQLAHIYNIPRKLGQQWVEQGQILPLLDGLDEMEEAARPGCIEAINTYHREYSGSLVVCSRTSEYERATRQKRLALHTAVVIQPLSQEKIDTHLMRLDKSLDTLRSTLKKNPTLTTLATTPLILQVLMLTYHDLPIRGFSQKEAQLREQIWTDYVQRMVMRKGDIEHYPLHHTITWLAWLARQMRDHNQTIFSLEHLQPDWLSERQEIMYLWSVGLLAGLSAGLSVGLLFGLLATQSVGLLFGLLAGLLAGLIGAQQTKIEPAEALTWSWKGLRFGLNFGLITGLSVGLIIGLIAGLPTGLIAGLLFGLLAGLPTGLIAGLRFGLSGKQFTERLTLSPNEGIRRSMKNGVLVWLLVGLFFGLLVGLLVGLFFGLLAVLQHYMLRFWFWHAHLFPWKAISFLEDATARSLLRRVGGGYSFTHRLLLDYFADLNTTRPNPLSSTYPRRHFPQP